MIATDKSIRYQQNLAGRRLALVVIGANDWTLIRERKSAVDAAIAQVVPGSFIEIEIPRRAPPRPAVTSPHSPVYPSQ